MWNPCGEKLQYGRKSAEDTVFPFLAFIPVGVGTEKKFKSPNVERDPHLYSTTKV
jgi:hypothetical protein